MFCRATHLWDGAMNIPQLPWGLHTTTTSLCTAITAEWNVPFQQNQRDAHASTMAGSTKMARASAPAANISVPASTALSAALLSVATSCPQPHHPAPTHDWSGYLGSAASASTAIRAPGGYHISIRLVFVCLFFHLMTRTLLATDNNGPTIWNLFSKTKVMEVQSIISCCGILMM